MKHSPCEGCERRKVGCHVSCKEYAEYEKEINKARTGREKRTRSCEQTSSYTQRITNWMRRG